MIMFLLSFGKEYQLYIRKIRNISTEAVIQDPEKFFLKVVIKLLYIFI